MRNSCNFITEYVDQDDYIKADSLYNDICATRVLSLKISNVELPVVIAASDIMILMLLMILVPKQALLVMLLLMLLMLLMLFLLLLLLLQTALLP